MVFDAHRAEALLRAIGRACTEAGYRLRSHSHKEPTMYKLKNPLTFEAHQWFKNGDHPHDKRIGWDPDKHEGLVVRRFRRPDVNGGDRCDRCGIQFQDHGFLDTGTGDENRVCPGDYILTPSVGVPRFVVSREAFWRDYEGAEVSINSTAEQRTPWNDASRPSPAGEIALVTGRFFKLAFYANGTWHDADTQEQLPDAVSHWMAIDDPL